MVFKRFSPNDGGRWLFWDKRPPIFAAITSDNVTLHPGPCRNGGGLSYMKLLSNQCHNLTLINPSDKLS